jgi:hypothetical protein
MRYAKPGRERSLLILRERPVQAADGNHHGFFA